MPYSTEAELIDYATARGHTLVKDASVLLTLSNDWIEAQAYKGYKTDPTQMTQWPRKEVTAYGVLVDELTVPQGIKNGEMAMAIEIDKGNDPYQPVERAAVRERVEGAVEVNYSDRGSAPQTVQIRSVTPLIREYLKSGGGLSVVAG